MLFHSIPILHLAAQKQSTNGRGTPYSCFGHSDVRAVGPQTYHYNNNRSVGWTRTDLVRCNKRNANRSDVGKTA